MLGQWNEGLVHTYIFETTRQHVIDWHIVYSYLYRLSHQNKYANNKIKSKLTPIEKTVQLGKLSTYILRIVLHEMFLCLKFSHTNRYELIMHI